MPSRPFLERRNALWRELRTLPPGSPEFEAALNELRALIGWDRAQVLSGLGLPELGMSGEGPGEERP